MKKQPKYIIHYGCGGKENCYSKKDLGDFIASALELGYEDFKVEVVS